MSRAVTEEEFLGWRSHPVTEAVMAILGKRREELRQQWEGGSFTDYEKEGTVLVNVGNVGTCKGYAYVQDLSYEDYLGEIDDRKQLGVGPQGRGGAD